MSQREAERVAGEDAREGRLGNVAGAILMGGASRRMGRDKAALAVGGIPMATRIATLLDGLFDELLLVGGDPPPDAPGCRVADASDDEATRSALRGIVSALEATTRERLVVVATDLPLLTPELVLGLVAWPEHDVVLPRDDHGLHPLCAIYRKEPVLDVARGLLEAGRFKLTTLLDAVDTDVIDGQDLQRLDPDGLALSNVNEPEEAARVVQHLPGASGSDA